MAKRILVIGSIRPPFADDGTEDPSQWKGTRFDDPETEEVASFRRACVALGRALAEDGWDFVVGTDDAIDADPWIVEGARTAPGRDPEITVVRPLSASVRLDRYLSKQWRFVEERASGSWWSVQVTQLRMADAVLLIGGRGSVRTVGNGAVLLQRTVLALPWFGRTSKEVFDELHSTHYGALGAALSDLQSPPPPDDSAATAGAAKAVAALTTLIGARAFRVSHQLYSPAVVGAMTFGVTALLLAAWVALFAYAPAGPVSYFGVLFVAAGLGLMLRGSLRVLENPKDVVSLRVFWAEVRIGFVLAFALALLFLVGAVTIVGDPSIVFGNGAAESRPAADGAKALFDGAFRRTAVTMTLLGLAGGLLIEKAAEAVRRALGGRLDAIGSGK